MVWIHNFKIYMSTSVDMVQGLGFKTCLLKNYRKHSTFSSTHFLVRFRFPFTETNLGIRIVIIFFIIFIHLLQTFHNKYVARNITRKKKSIRITFSLKNQVN